MSLSMKQPTVICVGETLWDLLPSGEFIGGAPFNAAAHVARLGAHSVLISRVGNDQRGHDVMRAATQFDIDTTLMQADASYPTGVAHASLDPSGSACYTFPQPAAWDAIEATPAAVTRVARADAVIYGTLSQRAEPARQAIRQLVAAGRFRVLDVNLRSPYIDPEVVIWSLARATLAKFNEDECRAISAWLGCGAEPEQLRQALMQRNDVNALCITRGPQGALLYWDGLWYDQPAIPTRVEDTVGAGDAFLAMLVVELLHHEPPQRALLHAARLAGFVASCRGAVPPYEAHVFRD